MKKLIVILILITFVFGCEQVAMHSEKVMIKGIMVSNNPNYKFYYELEDSLHMFSNNTYKIGDILIYKKVEEK